MEYLDICDEHGIPTGSIIDRETAHRDGIPHRTSHVWVIRETDGTVQVLLQKRSIDKDSFPGMYDVSSAGHIPAGDDPLRSILREMEEEIGIHAEPAQLEYAGWFHCDYQAQFHGQVFHDNEIRFAYVYQEPVELGTLTLQRSEVEEVRWFNLHSVYQEVLAGSNRICASAQGLNLLRTFLNGRY